MILLFFLYQIILFIYFWTIYGIRDNHIKEVHDNQEDALRNTLIMSYIVFSFLICTVFILLHIISMYHNQLMVYKKYPKRFQNCVVFLTLFSSISIRDYVIRQIPENKIQIDIMILIIFSTSIIFFVLHNE